jgi:hypothetical protein
LNAFTQLLLQFQKRAGRCPASTRNRSGRPLPNLVLVAKPLKNTGVKEVRDVTAQYQKKKPGCCRAFLTNYFFVQSFRQLGDLMCKPRNLSARIVPVNYVALGCLHQFGFRTGHRLQGCVAVAALDCLFDNADCTTHLGAPRFVDDGPAGNLARRLLGGSRIGHFLKYPSA